MVNGRKTGRTQFVSTRVGGDKMPDSEWKKHLANETEPEKDARHKREEKIRYTEKMTPAPTRSTPLPPYKTKRPFTPGFDSPKDDDDSFNKKKHTSLKAKKYKEKERTYKSFGKNGMAKAKSVYAFVNPTARSTKTDGTNPIYGKSKRLKNVASRPTSVKDPEGTEVAQGDVVSKKGTKNVSASNFKKQKYDTKKNK